MTEPARAIGDTRSGLTRLIERLERDGHVSRRACAEDGRGSVAELTATGRAAFHAAHEVHVRQVRERFLDRFSEAELARLVEMWERLLPGSTA